CWPPSPQLIARRKCGPLRPEEGAVADGTPTPATCNSFYGLPKDLTQAGPDLSGWPLRRVPPNFPFGKVRRAEARRQERRRAAALQGFAAAALACGASAPPPLRPAGGGPSEP